MRAAVAREELLPLEYPNAASSRQILLASLEGQRRLRAYRLGGSLERWLKSWARRWYVVRATSADEARAAVKAYLADCAEDPALTDGIDAGAYGIHEAGRNARGGPRRLPKELADRSDVRPTPASLRGRRARARGPTGKGKRRL